MTTTEIAQLLRVAEEEIRQQQDAHPEITYAVAGTACLLRSGLASAAGMRHAPVRRAYLAAVAQTSADTLRGALIRRPHLAEKAETLLDCATSLLSIADAARLPEAP